MTRSQLRFIRRASREFTGRVMGCLSSLLGTADPTARFRSSISASGALVGTAQSMRERDLDVSSATTDATTFTATASEITGSVAGQETAADGTTANQNQAWGFTTGPMPNGVHNFTVTSTDAAGNISATSAVLPSQSIRLHRLRRPSPRSRPTAASSATASPMTTR